MKILIYLFLSYLLKLTNCSQEIDSINKYLADNVKSKSLPENFAALEDWLLRRVSRSCLVELPSSRKLTKAIRQVISLESFINDECNLKSLQTLRYINKELGFGGPENHMLKGVTSQLSHIVHECGKRHAQRCRSIYPQRYEQKVGQIDKSVLEQVDRLLSELALNIMHNEPGLRSQSFNDDTQRAAKLDSIFLEFDPIQVQEVVQTLNGLSLDDANSAHHERVHQMYGAYIQERLVKPCAYFIRELEDIVEPALAERAIYMMYQYNDHVEFRRALGLFTWCKKIVDQKDELIDKLNR